MKGCNNIINSYRWAYRVSAIASLALLFLIPACSNSSDPKEPNLILRLSPKTGSFITEGNWEMGGNLEQKK